jgi:hypothetical protein
MRLKTMALAGTALATMTIGLATPAFAATHAVRQAVSQAVPPVPPPAQEAAPSPAPAPPPPAPPRARQISSDDDDRDDRDRGDILPISICVNAPARCCIDDSNVGLLGTNLDKCTNISFRGPEDE